MKSVKIRSTISINRRRAERGELWQARFFDRALRTVKEYNDKVEYIHLNPVKAGLVQRPEDWPWAGGADSRFVEPAISRSGRFLIRIIPPVHRCRWVALDCLLSSFIIHNS